MNKWLAAFLVGIMSVLLQCESCSTNMRAVKADKSFRFYICTAMLPGAFQGSIEVRFQVCVRDLNIIFGVPTPKHCSYIQSAYLIRIMFALSFHDLGVLGSAGQFGAAHSYSKWVLFCNYGIMHPLFSKELRNFSCKLCNNQTQQSLT